MLCYYFIYKPLVFNALFYQKLIQVLGLLNFMSVNSSLHVIADIVKSSCSQVTSCFLELSCWLPNFLPFVTLYRACHILHCLGHSHVLQPLQHAKVHLIIATEFLKSKLSINRVKQINIFSQILFRVFTAVDLMFLIALVTISLHYFILGS